MFAANIRRNICRHKGKSLISFGIAAMMVFFLNVYMGNLESFERQLERLSGILSVSGRVCNLNGSQTVGLEIPEQTLDGIRNSTHVKKTVYSMQLAGAEGTFPKEEWKQYLDFAVQAVNEVEGIAGIEEGSVQLADGVQTDFIKSENPYVLVDRIVLENRGWSVGDRIPLTIYYYAGSSLGETDWQYLMTEEFTIIGTMEIAGNADVTTLMSGAVPYAWAEKQLKERQYSYFADSLSFELKSGEEINSFKREMKKLKLLDTVSTAKPSLSGNALVLDDTAYIETASQLRKNMQMFQRYLPLFLLVIAGAGYTISYLMVQSRKNEYAIMRILGQSKKECFRQFMSEFLLTECCGGLIGTAAALFLLSIKMQAALLIFGIFLLCYFCGTMMALKALNKKALITALAQKE